LKKQPRDVYGLPSRRFEELVAELLQNKGYSVQLTQETRDGGKDILAFFDTQIGSYLTLVEAKRYAARRPVRVLLVRTLYGTLADYQANSAMLVTTSRFSSDAREFQKNHKYQLSLKDYADVTDWIKDYRSK
jgi:restriction system protein